MAAATAIALGATSVISAGASFKAAMDQERKRREADEAAGKYMEDARKKFSVNFAEQLQVPLEGYEMASDLNRQALAQNTEALKESGQRAILGGVAGLQQQAQAGAEQLIHLGPARRDEKSNSRRSSHEISASLRRHFLY